MDRGEVSSELVVETLGVTGLDRLQEGLVVVEDTSRHACVPMHGSRRHATVPFPQRRIETGQERVVTGRRDELMELGVDACELRHVDGVGPAVGGEILAQADNEVGGRGRAGHHGSNGVPLQEQAGVDDVAGLPVADRDHESTALRVETHPAFRLQTQECLTHRGATHCALRGDLTLADQLTAGNLVCENLLFDLGIYPFSSGFSGRMRHRHKLYLTNDH